MVPRTLAAQYRNRTADVRHAAKDLNARAIVTGQLILRGEQLHLQVELVDVTTMAQLWGDQFDRQLADLATISGDLSRTLAAKLRVQLTGDDRRSLDASPTKDPAAYQIYLRGRYEAGRRNKENLARAIEYFQQAIARDPSFALAYAGLAYTYNLLAIAGHAPGAEVFPKAIAAGQKALELDERSADAHAAVGTSALLVRMELVEKRSGARAGSSHRPQ